MTSTGRIGRPGTPGLSLFPVVIVLVVLCAAAAPAAAVGPTVSRISAGNAHTCARMTDGSAWCWGWNIDAMLGDGTTITRAHAVRVTKAGGGSLDDVAAISAGAYHTCARTNDGAAWCWGSNLGWELGIGPSPSHRPRAVRVRQADGSFLGGVIGITAGYVHTCATTSDGAAWCWGTNTHGELGDGTSTDRSRAVRVTRAGGSNLTGIVGISAGGNHVSAGGSYSAGQTCAWTGGGAAWCWGDNRKGQLGDGTTTDRHRAVRVTQADGGPLGGVTAVSVGRTHSCARRTDGTAWCWGWNGDGQLGDGTRTERHHPVQVTRSGGANLSDVAVIDAGTLHTCAVTRDLAAWCWGNNKDGQLGDGTATFKRRAVRVTKAGSPLGGVEPLGGIVGISAGGWHSCAAARDGAAWCWGEGSLGQVGGEDIYSDNFYRAVRVVPTWAQ